MRNCAYLICHIITCISCGSIFQHWQNNDSIKAKKYNREECWMIGNVGEIEKLCKVQQLVLKTLPGLATQFYLEGHQSFEEGCPWWWWCCFCSSTLVQVWIHHVGHLVSYLIHLHVDRLVSHHVDHHNIVSTICEGSESLVEWKSQSIPYGLTDWPG